MKRQTPGRAAVCAASMLLGAALFAVGGSVRTVDGKAFEGTIRFNDAGAVVVGGLDGVGTTVDLTNIAHASFAPGQFLSGGSILPNGWFVQDVGDVRGMTRLDGDAFTLRVEGQTTNATASHFVYRPMPSDGEIVARVDHVGGSAAGFAGVMIRSANNSSMFVSLARGADGRLWFHRRLSVDRKEVRLTPGPQVGAAPVWLRLQKRGLQVAAFHSPDGSTWQAMAREPIGMSLERTWREYEGELKLLRAQVGVFGASRAAATLCTARVAQVSLILNGVLGEYFDERNFQTLRFARLDPQIKFDWRQGSPEPSLRKDDFSVRWTGSLVPPRAGEYRFYVETEESARLWLAGREIARTIPNKPDKRALSAPMRLGAGLPLNLKLEFERGERRASVKLGWYHGDRDAGVIAMTNFVHGFTATNSPEGVAAARATNDMPAVRGVWLRDGSFIAGTVAMGDESAVKLSFGGRKDVPILNSRVARLILRPPRQRLAFEIAHGRRGLFLKDGDFFESDFRRVEHGSLSVSSVLFGLKRYRIEGGDAAVFVLNDFVPSSARYRVRLLNGSILCAMDISAGADSIRVEEPLLGWISIPVADLFEIETVPPVIEAAARR